MTNSKTPSTQITEQTTGAPPRRKREMPHVFVILMAIITIAAILTHIVPAGIFDRETVDGRDVIIDGTFHAVDPTPASFWDILTAVFNGMVGAADIIFYVFIVGASFGVLRATGAIDSAVAAMTQRLRGKEILFIPVLMTFFSLTGAMLGLAEETIPYITILVPIAVALGYDSMVGAAVVLLGTGSGFMAAFMNPFTVGVAQGIAGLPLFSGMWLRLILWALLLGVAIVFVMRYAQRMKKDPTKGMLYQQDSLADEIRQNGASKTLTFTLRHKLVFVVLIATLVTLAICVSALGWYLTEIAGLFLLMGIVMGAVGGLGMNGTAEAFITGARDLVTGALVIGVAYGILVIFQDGQILDTILVNLADLIGHLPPWLSAVGMFFFQGLVSFIVPSGSGQAALTMPIISPLAEMVGVTQQTAVLAFQLADGIGNLCFPTSGFFMAALALARVPWIKWVRWMLPLIAVQVTIAIAAVVFAHLIGYS